MLALHVNCTTSGKAQASRSDIDATSHTAGKFVAHIEGAHLQAPRHPAAMTGMRRGEVLGPRWQDVAHAIPGMQAEAASLIASLVRESAPPTDRLALKASRPEGPVR